MVAGLAAGVHALFVVVGAEVLVARFGVGQQGVTMVRIEFPVATRAFFLGMRLAIRRYLAPRNELVRLAPIAASPRAALR